MLRGDTGDKRGGKYIGAVRDDRRGGGPTGKQSGGFDCQEEVTRNLQLFVWKFPCKYAILGHKLAGICYANVLGRHGSFQMPRRGQLSFEKEVKESGGSAKANQEDPDELRHRNRLALLLLH